MPDEPTPVSPPQPNDRTAAAVAELQRLLAQVDTRELDPLTASWSDIEPAVARLLGGPFDQSQQGHRMVAMLLAAAFGARITSELGGFWFINRSAPDGAAVGFSDAVVMISPLEVVVQALSRAQLRMLEEVAKELRSVLGRARLSAGTPARLGPDDYRRLFDPGFLQFLTLDESKAAAAWQNTSGAVVRELEDAFTRLPSSLPQQVREGMRNQIVGALKQLGPDEPLLASIPRAASLVEMLTLLYGAGKATGFAPAELWQDVLVPLLHIGAASTFPELDDDEKTAAEQGAEPLLLYIETVPYRTPAADEDGVLGAFPESALQLLAPAFGEGGAAPRLFKIDLAGSGLDVLLATFDPAAVRSAVERFAEGVKQATEGRAFASASGGAPGEPSLLDVSLALLQDLKAVAEVVRSGDGVLCLRRTTEAEAASEPSLRQLGKALTGPRIILA